MKTSAVSGKTRELLMSDLRAGAGTWVSGQSLGERLAMTRSAVWKQICALKEEGYVIESSPRKGYRFCEVPDRLLIREIREGLATRTLGQGDIRYYRQTDSTNLRAREMAAQGFPEGTLVVAEEQTQGRGRLGRHWFSPPLQGIYASLILRPAIPPHEAPRMTLLSSVAVAEAILGLTPLAVKIKWPNDILVGGRKIAGILTEISAGMDTVDHMIVGLGLNVNIPADAFPREIHHPATSILAETGVFSSRIKLLHRCLECYESYYDIFKTKGFDPVMDRWKSLTEMMGRRVMVQMVGGRHVGKVSHFDQEGFLVLRDDRGESIRIFSGDVTLL
jgi:BirA family transcriptional regulator, biotin operon repressor / biotin---[acetyl-CoA-carboxylase] ligase